MKPEKITILNNKKQKLIGKLYKGSSKTLIIICHGIESANNTADQEMKEILINEYFPEVVTQTKASVFSFDFSGYGDSEGKEFLSFRQRNSEIHAVLTHFSSQYNNIILYGFSMGAVSATIAALRYKEITGLITVNGFFSFDPKHLFLSHIPLILSYLLSNPRFALELFYWKKYYKVKKIATPTLIVYGDNDTFVSSKQSINFFKQLTTNKKQVSYSTRDHTLRKYYLQLPKEIAKWLKEEGKMV